MCGICGFVSRGGEPVNRELFTGMTRLAAHRGPDDEGFFYEGNLALGHRRLSIIGLGREGHQPMRLGSRYTVVYNGEIYNYIELRAELEAEGVRFYTACDTEVLLAAYARWGPACTARFNGMWAFALYDAKERTLFCSRDRFGIKPFYYTLNEKRLAFASEIKQLLPLWPAGPTMNIARAWDFLCCGLTEHDDNTFFEGIHQLRGGHEALYRFENDTWEVRRWYSLADIMPKHGVFEQNARIFRGLFEDAVRLRLRADVPVGSCLSGGLDSSAIVCAAAKTLRDTPLAPRQHTVSSVYDDPDEAGSDEQVFIDAVVEETGVTAHKVRLRPEYLFANLDKMLWHNDEPYSSTSPCAQWVVFEEAKRQGLTVMLDGQGSDEQLAGYSSFFVAVMAHLLAKGRYIKLYKAVKWFNRFRACDEGVPAGRYLDAALTSPAISRLRGIPHLMRLYRALKNRRMRAKQAGFEVPWPYDLALSGAPGYFNEHDFRQFTLNMIEVNIPSLLHYEDRNSMAHSIESRVPFLDYKLAEAVFAMPLEHKIRDGVTKAVMREGLRGQLTETVRTRFSKLGFATPEEVWMRQNARWFRGELVKACGKLSNILDEERVLAWFDGCRRVGKKDFLSFRIICLARWAEVFNVKING